ncbi:hypothetical protein BDV59DRAFT_195349 [Aspergillus ambiguus]|uniref:uncharacterized protein n=1 Tax=Aspergillus ambiguus TaxID=176160 RepID=UPI003CCD0B55
MSDKPSPLGLFGKLPIEIRIPIWADVLSSRQPAVLRTSRAIYVEIAYLMYPALDYTLFPDYDSPWLRLHCPWTGTTFDISRRDGRRKRKKLWALSYNNTVLTIRIIAPDPTQRGEVVLLWQKTQDLVSILNRSKYYRAHIVIELQETDIEKNTWEENGSYTYINGYGRPNYFIIFLPFCRLVRARKIELVRVTPNGCKAQIDDRFLEYGCDFIINNGYKTRNTSVLRNDWKYRYIAPEFDNIDKILVDIDFFLENQLDDLPGHTAAMLRLDRFANWFPTKYPYESQYQRRYLLTVRKYPKTIKRHDTWLRHMRRRYRAFQYLYFHVTKNKNSNFVMCNPRAWYDKFPDGIYQLTRARIAAPADIPLNRDIPKPVMDV